jgi:biopolymer transport protein ExbD/biopolymer transport protein TolR
MKDADRDDAIYVTITRDGNVFLGSAQIRIEELLANVQDMIANRVDKTVYLKSDMRAKYETVVDVVNEIRSAGVDQLGLITEKVESRQLAQNL